MKNRTIKIAAVLMSLFSLMINLYYFVNQDVYSQAIIKINIAAGFLLLVLVILPAILRRLKK